ncbi:AbiTii domain-containing protein [Spongiibacter marinus]|uniref:AbiTii domain-containing protein n=1 Tax=Spongiibacter marinus TaxID=354246 RepID=UPI003562C4F2
MALLHEIQESVVKDGAELGSVLLKLRLLAARLGSDVLEEWVKHESEGYPKNATVPSYRVVGVSYKGTFFGPFNAQISNAPIPPYIIQKYAGEKWVKIDVRESIAAVDSMVRKTADGGAFGIDASNLILLLQGKIYEDYSCASIDASVSPTAFGEIIQAVRSRVLELTLELERTIPAAAHVSFGASQNSVENSEKVQQISQQIIYGNVTNAVSGSPASSISISVVQGDQNSLEQHLVESGMLEDDAKEIAGIIASEEPESAEEPFGDKAKAWVAENLTKAAKGTWKMGVSAATSVLTKAALKYYGL